MLDEEDTDKDGMSLEVDTPVTNHRGDDDDDEEGGSSLLALVGEWPDPGMLLERGSSGMLSRQLFPSQSDALVVHALDTSLLC